MTQEDIINEYKEKICPYCKGKCNKGIIIIEDNFAYTVKCVDYKKDKTKTKGYIRPLKRNAKIGSCVMKGLVRIIL